VTTLSDTPLEIVHTPDGVRVGESSLIKPDIYASNGVIHLVSSLLLPAGHSSLKLTPEKFLLALNCSSFVSMLHSVNLTSFIDSSHPDQPITILAPNDEVLALFDEGNLPERGSEELKRMLAYHFLDGLWEPDQLRDGQLVQTLLEEEGLEENKQVLQIDVSGKTIRFAGASVVGEKGKSLGHIGDITLINMRSSIKR
jgi:solute carrier family 25 carnitine/acylcarnitine transporter 20/29